MIGCEGQVRFPHSLCQYNTNTNTYSIIITTETEIALLIKKCKCARICKTVDRPEGLPPRPSRLCRSSYSNLAPLLSFLPSQALREVFPVGATSACKAVKAHAHLNNLLKWLTVVRSGQFRSECALRLCQNHVMSCSCRCSECTAQRSAV